jgi:DnaJ-domain-containing protein 1
MPRTKSNKPKRNIWSDPSPYGTYQGDSGNPSSWAAAFEFAAYSREKSLGILINVIESPFQILGLTPSATQEEIKTAWRKLVLINHPDKGGDRNKFEQIMAAYSILQGN